MKQFLKKYGKWLVLGILCFTFVIITHNLIGDNLTDFDTMIHDFVISSKSPILTYFFLMITFFASPLFLIVLSIFLFFIFKNKKYAILSLVNLIVVTCLNQVLKIIFSRPRPFEWMLIEESGYSFPSGHAMVSMGVYGMLIYLIWKTNMKNSYKKLLTVILSVLIFLIGLSRIYLGVHYASDILAGFALSLSYLIIACSLVSYYLKVRQRK